MSNIVAVNKMILKEWKESNEKNYGETNFAPDGIMYRGIIDNYGSGIERLESTDGEEDRLWSKAPLRILFFTKDQNAGTDNAHDVREEVGRLSMPFYWNLMYQLYGLVNTTPDFKPSFQFTDEKAKEVYDTFPLARINAKKEAGGGSLDNSTLRRYLNRKEDKEFLRRQITNLDADIIVCCGFSESIEESGNLLLNFLNNTCGYHFIQQNKENENWMWYDEKENKLAINNFHLSVRFCSEAVSEKIYNEMIDAYHSFLMEHPDFIKSHRK